MAKSWCAITAIIIKMAIMAAIAHRDMAINMVLMGVFLEYRKNADHWSKRCSKLCMYQKVMTKTISLSILWPFPLYFEANIEVFWAMDS